VLTTNQKGAIAETAIVHEATKHGIDVYRPIAEGGRYDMLFDLGSQIVRVQCKWAPRHRDVLVVRCYSTRRNGSGLLRRIYVPGEIEYEKSVARQRDGIPLETPTVEELNVLAASLGGPRLT